MPVYDIAVIGAGAAGVMAAIAASMLSKNVVLIERNSCVGKKLLLTGKGRCNITNAAGIDTFIEAFGRQGSFLRSAFFAFSNCDLINFFKARGLALKTERQGRVFPVTDKTSSVIEVLKRCLLEKKVKILYNTRLAELTKKNGFFELKIMEKKDKIYARRVILATGGVSFKATGSSGDGFRIAEKLRHTIVSLKPALVPLRTKELWVKQLQGLSLKNIRIIFSVKGGSLPVRQAGASGGKCGSAKITSEVGEIMFTHFGISGPLVLDLSGRIVSLIQEYGEILLFVDLKPGLSPEQIDNRLIREFNLNKNSQLKNIMKSLLPHRLIPVFLDLSGILPEKRINQISHSERQVIVRLLKALPLTIKGSLSIDEAMVTNGGISIKEINPRTMESRIVPGLYFAGEIIDGCASSGGYNLQQAFSTGFLAGRTAAYA